MCVSVSTHVYAAFYMPSTQETQKMGTKSPGIGAEWWVSCLVSELGSPQEHQVLLPDESSLQHQGTQSCQANRW